MIYRYFKDGFSFKNEKLSVGSKFSIFINGVFFVETVARSSGIASDELRVRFSQSTWALVGDGDLILVKEEGGQAILRATIHNGIKSNSEVLIEKIRSGYVVGSKGALRKPVESRGDWIAELLNFSKYTCDKFEEVIGEDLVLIHGTLLGAARKNEVMSYDHDIDLAYVIKAESHDDYLESYYKAIVVLINSGENIQIVTNEGKVRKNFFMWYSHDGKHKVDIFPFWFDSVNHEIIGSFSVYGKIKEKDIYPFKEIMLNGERFKSINNHELILEYTYGSDWKVPDPLWKKWEISPSINKKLKALDLTRDMLDRLCEMSVGLGLSETFHRVNNKSSNVDLRYDPVRRVFYAKILNNQFSDEAVEIAFYLIRNNYREKVRWYDCSELVEFNLPLPTGCYHVKAFYRVNGEIKHREESNYISFNDL